MNIEDLTIREAKELAALFNGAMRTEGLKHSYVGRQVIIRTYSAGVWFGVLKEKAGNEVILSGARRMWSWKAAKSISLSAVAQYGIKAAGSKLAPAVENTWLEAIEILPCTDLAVETIMEQEDVKAG